MNRKNIQLPLLDTGNSIKSLHENSLETSKKLSIAERRLLTNPNFSTPTIVTSISQDPTFELMSPMQPQQLAFSFPHLLQQLSPSFIPSFLLKFSRTSQEAYSELKLCFMELEQAEIHRTATKSNKIATSQQNLSKNRYSNIMPFDDNIVPLTLFHDNHYINASFIHTFQTFIATQGPLPNTIVDFWSMVWTQKSQVIVMLTEEEEGGRNKCHCYWPTIDNPILSWSNNNTELKVAFILETQNDICTFRQFHITCIINGASETRTIQMLHFKDWADHSTSDSNRVKQLIQHAQQLNKSETPMVVHCSAGVGRTGTFISIATVLHILNTNYDRNVDIVKETVDSIRKQRVSMVQGIGQLCLIYECIILELIKNS